MQIDTCKLAEGINDGGPNLYNNIRHCGGLVILVSQREINFHFFPDILT